MLNGNVFELAFHRLFFCFNQEFVKRYSLLFPQKENGSLREEMPAILESLGLDPREYQTGKEKVSESDLQPWSKIFFLCTV